MFFNYFEKGTGTCCYFPISGDGASVKKSTLKKFVEPGIVFALLKSFV